jgi:protein involved in polysaccharide export with SLBB domain
MKFVLFFATTCLLCLAVPAFSQNAQQLARTELERRGLDENQVRERLKQRGIDIDNVKPEQIPALQPTIEAVIGEIEQENRNKAAATPANPTQGVPTSAQDGSPAATPEQKKTDERTKEIAPGIQENLKSGATVEEAVSEELAERVQEKLPEAKIYGQSLFRDKNLGVFRVSNDVKPPDSYLLGPGDEITISIFGPSQADFKHAINKEGYIQPSNLPKIFLKGVSLGKAKELIRARLSQFYVFRPEQFSLSLSTARSITVNIFGETANYGSFTLSAINTAFNALVAAGGPSDIGSVRNIKVVRGKETKRLDVYAFMSDPTLNYDFYLEENDLIHVPVANRVISVTGEVQRPFRYELLENEQLSKLLEYAGGFTPRAYKSVLQIRRFVDNEIKQIDIPYEQLLAQKQDCALLPGDVVVVRPIPDVLERVARIEGAVDLPETYALTPGMRLSDLVKLGQLRREARTDIAFLVRTKPNAAAKLIQIDLTAALANPQSAADLLLEPRDRVTVLSQSRFADRGEINVTGAVRNPLKESFDPLEPLTLQNALLLADGLKPEADTVAYIIRKKFSNPKETTYIRVNIEQTEANMAALQKVPLLPLDEVRVLSKLAYTDAFPVRISGAVRNPGEFPYSPDLRIGHLITLAGGLKHSAARNRIDIFRVVFNQNEATTIQVATIDVNDELNNPNSKLPLQPYDQVVVRDVPEYALQKTVSLEGEVRYPGFYALLDKNETLASVIQRAGGLSAEAFPEGASIYRAEENAGFVVTRLGEALRHKNSNQNILLKAGDIISIPRRKDLVAIRTPYTRANELYPEKYLLYPQVNVAWTPGRTARWYIREYAAGFGDKAARAKVSVVQPNGNIDRTVNLGLFKISPKVQKGGVISVGAKKQKPEKDKNKERKPFDWDKALTQVLSVASVTATMVLAITALNK